MTYLSSIKTKYSTSPSTGGGRIRAKASNGAGSVTVHYDHHLNTESNHMAAARKLAEKLGWKGTYIAGGDDNKGGMVWVNMPTELTAFAID